MSLLAVVPALACEGNATTQTLAERAEALAALPAGTCGALIDAWQPAPGDDPYRVWQLATSFSWDWQDVAIGDATCPCEAESGAVTGDCTSSGGWSFTGQYGVSGGKYGVEVSPTLWGSRFDDGADAYEQLAHGSAFWGSGLYLEPFRESLTTRGAYASFGTHTTIREGIHTGGAFGEIYLYIVESSDVTTGDLCVHYDLHEQSGAEPSGIIYFIGAQQVSVWFEGDLASDGCGRLFVDGVEEGEACFDEFTAQSQTPP